MNLKRHRRPYVPAAVFYFPVLMGPDIGHHHDRHHESSAGAALGTRTAFGAVAAPSSS
eukprot:CAMPEP_0184394066 /NCGR_PEP_ID=MMETSP0007-20130409/38328_1 /TAXON_ID=97485 /ORGANISM="Prymnesium parvum, Strain Texoma1" /LENGTH=57 /DNA_ID=CAMNT_0026745443 /DNA_START=256 /DNA_END=429 /DNA_ORIENTATION=-